MTNEGLEGESVRISAGESMVSRKLARDGQVNSPDRRNPKKPRQQAAQSMTLSWETGKVDHV